ncbi:MAG: DUF1254 domain-containing protein [Verrucomicrobiaceae bacterium]|nr:MAG: DUF1254 domain-containing protein [Verrucomicrobiaceae bacterium]
MKFTKILLAAVALSGAVSAVAQVEKTFSPEEVRAVAKEAYIYGFPLVDNYRIQHSYFVDKGGKEYKAAWNTIYNNARVYTPDDKAIQTPNSDTPYSYVGADLRAEPLVITVPEVEKGRYYSLQFIDQYTFNFAYVGSRATGNGAGDFLLAGPGWKGDKPEGIKDVIRCETDFAFVLYRTQLFNTGEVGSVRKIQEGYKVTPLSAYQKKAAPAALPELEFPKPLAPEEERSSVEFFAVMDFVLKSCPVNPAEVELRERFAKVLRVGGDAAFQASKLDAGTTHALQQGIMDAWAAFKEFKETQLDTGKRSSGDAFGTREFLKGDYMSRFSGAVLGIYGNSKAEAIYPVYFTDSDKQKLDGVNRYTLKFPADGLPPVNAFWSLTMYELPASLLVANPLDRYLINSPMVDSLKRDADGGITLHLQHESPGKEKEANWLPAPKGAFLPVLRLYWPKEEALDGRWKAPALVREK